MKRAQSEGTILGSTEPAPPVGGYFVVDGRRLFVYRSGSGVPAVVFLAGAGTVGLDYLNVQEGAADLSTSVLYDRAGSGWSDAVELPRTLTQVTDELRELLHVVGVSAPYVLVGHSLGGLYARHYAQRFPDEVAGLVLLDPAHEDWDAYMPPELTQMQQRWSQKQFSRLGDSALATAMRSAFGRSVLLRLPVIRHYRELYRTLFEQEMENWPQEIREVLIERHASLDWLWVGVREAKNVDELYAEARQAGSLPDVPVIILCSMGTDGFKDAVSVGESESLLQAEIDGKRRLYMDLADSVPHGEVRLVDSGHVTMNLRHPEAVVDAIRDVLQLLRDSETR